MEENLGKIELFFKLNLKIKNELLKIAPTEDDNYSVDSRIKYGDRLYFALQDMQDDFMSICDLLNMSRLKEHINKLFQRYNQELLNCNYSFKKMQEFYQNSLSNMDKELIDRVKEVFVGYTLFGNTIEEMISSSKTINELLHVFHSYLLNNESIYQSMPRIATKNNNYGETITLYGKESNLSKMILDNFPNDLDVGITDIVSLNNKILIMIRDRGHALTIEIDIEEDKSMVRYFIPKICNPIKVNELKGINKVTKNVRFANGSFLCETQDVPLELYDFISKVPTDNDMFTYGGWHFTETLDDNISRTS